jgi:hypothetical protein
LSEKNLLRHGPISATGFVTQTVLNAYTGQTITATTVASANPGYKIKTIDIGDWDMDNSANVTVLHSVAKYKTIKVLGVTILPDGGANLPVSLSGFVPSTGTIDGGVVSVWDISTGIILARKAGGQFDSTFFDQTSYNRGTITILYEV